MRNIGEIHNNNDMSLMVSASVCPKSHGPAIKRQLPSSIGESTTTQKEEIISPPHRAMTIKGKGKKTGLNSTPVSLIVIFFLYPSISLAGEYGRIEELKNLFFLPRRVKKKGDKGQ